MNATRSLVEIYLDFKNFDVSDLQDWEPDEDEPKTKALSEDDGWISTAKPKGKNKSKGVIGGGSSKVFVNVCKKFQDFLWEARQVKNHVYEPTTLHNSIQNLFTRFRGYSQQDAQELLRHFLDALSSCEERRFSKEDVKAARTIPKRKLTEVERIFGGYLCNVVKCNDCNYKNRTFDFCLDIALNIDRDRKIVMPKTKVKPHIVEPKNKKKQETPSNDKEEEKTGETKPETEESKISDTKSEGI